MKKEFVIATVMVAILLLSVLIVQPVMSELGDENTTNISEGELPISIAATSDLVGKIAFTSDRDGVPGIYVMNADGSNVLRLTSDDDWAPAWSPDGKKIAFCSASDGDDELDYEIYVMNADGLNVVQLTSEDDVDPAWSPDGKKIAFCSGWDSDHPGIYVMNTDGSNVVQLTSEPDWEPAWSPDGKKIAFSSDRDGPPEIYVMNADGSNVVQLTINTALDVLPDWCSVQVWDLFIYDTNENGIIEKCEAGNAAKDYFDGNITKEQALEVLLLHFATQP